MLSVPLRHLWWFTAANIAALVVCAAGFQLGIRTIRGAWFPIVNFAMFNIVMLILHLAWLPRIVTRRRAAEMAENPIGAERRRRHERRYAIVGWVGGLGFGWVGLLIGLLASNKL